MRRPYQPAASGNDGARDDEDLLVVIRRAARARSRAARSRAATATSSGPSGRSRSASHASRIARTSRIRAASAGALVATIPAPIATSPRARRVMSRQPPAVRLGTNGRSASSVGPSGRPPRRAPRPGRAAGGSCRRPRASCVAAVIRSGSAPAGRASRLDRVDPGGGRVPARHDDPRPIRRTGRPSRTAYPVDSRPAIGWPPTNGRPCDIGSFHDGGLRARDVGDGRVGAHGSLASGPASSSSQRRQSSGGAARTIRSAPSIASAGVAATRSRTSSARARRGPSPVGDQATSSGRAPSAARRARAMDPPMRPKPRNAMDMVRVSQPGRRPMRPAADQPGGPLRDAARSADPRPGARYRPAGLGRPADSDVGCANADRCPVAPYRAAPRTAGSVVPRRRATPAARRCRSGGRTIDRQARLSMRTVQTVGRPARAARPPRPDTRSPRASRSRYRS